MGRQLQKKKSRSSIPKQSRRRNPRVLKIKSFGSDIIAKNWNPKETLTQNYARLGLSARLNVSTWCPPTSAASKPEPTPAALQPGEARIIRDEEGNVVRVEHAMTADEALNAEPPAAQKGAQTEVVRKLEELATTGVKRERMQSDKEKQWVEQLMGKYGKDYAKMARDRRLNPMQQTVGDIRRRVERWEKRSKGGKEGGAEAEVEELRGMRSD